MADRAELAADVRKWLVAQQRPLTAASVVTALRAQDTVVGTEQMFDILALLRAELQGAGPLQQLLGSEGITDVLVNGPDQLWIEDGHGLRELPSPFRGEEEVRRLAQRLANLAHRRLDDAEPFCDARLPDGTRLHAVLSPLAYPGTLISLRLPPRRSFSIADLIAAKAITASGASWLAALVAAGCNFLISGGTGTGKTTVLGALLGLVPAAERVVILEDSAELRPAVQHLCALQGRPANVEGSGAITLTDLVRQSLRMRPDRIVVGEVRGAEVSALLAAFNTGHTGGAGTIHASTPSSVPARLEALAMAAGLDRDAVHSQMGAGLDAVLHLERTPKGRRIVSIGEFRRQTSGWCQVEPVISFAERVSVRSDSDLIRRLRAYR